MDQLKSHISELGISQSALAATLGVSKGHLSGLLSGRKVPSLELATRIERLTGGAVPASSWIASSPPATPTDSANP